MEANRLRHSYQFTLVYTDVTHHLSVLGPSTEVVLDRESGTRY